MPALAAPCLLPDISDPAARLARALELDARGGDLAWSQIKQIRLTMRQAYRVDPSDLGLAARLFNLSTLGPLRTEMVRLTQQVLALGPVDETVMSQWLLPSAGALTDTNHPELAEELLGLAPARYRRGEQWERVAEGLRRAHNSQQAWLKLRDLRNAYIPQKEFARQEAELREQMDRPYVALAWPYVTRYPELGVFLGMVEPTCPC